MHPYGLVDMKTTHNYIFGIVALALGASACGPQKFDVATSSEAQQSPGHFVIPPKVDILLAEDDTGSIMEAYEQIEEQIPQFLKSLEKKGWDYHFATTGLTTERAMSQVMASRYDGNWGAEWQASFPGAEPDTFGMVNPSVFRFPDAYTGFMTPQTLSNAGNGLEPGFETIKRTLLDQAPGTGFLRDDAMLVVLVMGNGNDTSGINFCTRFDGVTQPCNDGSWDSSLAQYKSDFGSLKLSPNLVKFYSAVADRQKSNCLGSRSYVGTRYQWMASALGGESYDICSKPVESVLEGVAANLESSKVAYRRRFLMINYDAEVSTIQITRSQGGESRAIEPGEINGWTYYGEVTASNPIYTLEIDGANGVVQQGKVTSGFAIELHGTAILSGDETAKVKSEPKT